MILRSYPAATALPRGFTPETGDDGVVSISHVPTDWTKPEAYLPPANITALSAETHAAIRYADDTCIMLQMPPGTGRSSNLLDYALAYALDKLNDRLMLLIDEANESATNGTFLMWKGARKAYLYKPKNATAPYITHDAIADTSAPDLLAGYELYQMANWDGAGAEPITAATLAYARRIVAVLPSSLGAPAIAPASDGTIALEWIPDDPHHKLDRLFLDIGPGRQWRAYWTLRTGEFHRIPHTGFSNETSEIIARIFRDLSA